jgi:hypothetical protein
MFSEFIFVSTRLCCTHLEEESATIFFSLGVFQNRRLFLAIIQENGTPVNRTLPQERKMSDDECGAQAVNDVVLPVAKLLIKDCLESHPASNRSRVWVQGHIRRLEISKDDDTTLTAVLDDGSGCLNVICNRETACKVAEYAMVVGTIQFNVIFFFFFSFSTLFTKLMFVCE